MTSVPLIVRLLVGCTSRADESQCPRREFSNARMCEMTSGQGMNYEGGREVVDDNQQPWPSREGEDIQVRTVRGCDG